MEHHKKLKSSSKFSTLQQLKKMIPQLLLSLSVFSFLFSFSSSSLYSSKSHYFSTNYFQTFRYALNKNCIFLICNGLLVFLAKTSGFVHSSHSALDLNDYLLKPIDDDLQITTEPKDHEELLNETENDRFSSTETRNEVSIFIGDSEEEGGLACCELEDVKNDEIRDGGSRKFWLFDDEDEQELYEDEEGETELLSTEELNQKFEDFIRRMKMEIMVNEAQQKQLVLVN